MIETRQKDSVTKQGKGGLIASANCRDTTGMLAKFCGEKYFNGCLFSNSLLKACFVLG